MNGASAVLTTRKRAALQMIVAPTILCQMSLRLIAYCETDAEFSRCTWWNLLEPVVSLLLDSSVVKRTAHVLRVAIETWKRLNNWQGSVGAFRGWVRRQSIFALSSSQTSCLQPMRKDWVALVTCEGSDVSSPRSRPRSSLDLTFPRIGDDLQFSSHRSRLGCSSFTETPRCCQP